MYAEWAIRNICHGLEQYFMLRPNAKLDIAVQKLVNSHNIVPSQHNPQLEHGMHASPYEVVNDPNLLDHMEQTLKEHHHQQYSMNIEKKLIKPAPKLKKVIL